MFSSISTLSAERPRDEPFKSNLRWILNSVQNIFPITTKRNCKVGFKLQILASCEQKASHILEASLTKESMTQVMIESDLKHGTMAQKISMKFKPLYCKYYEVTNNRL